MPRYHEEIIVLGSTDGPDLCRLIEEAMREGYVFHGRTFIDRGGPANERVESSLVQVMVRQDLTTAIAEGKDIRQHMREVDRARNLIAEKTKKEKLDHEQSDKGELEVPFG